MVKKFVGLLLLLCSFHRQARGEGGGEETHVEYVVSNSLEGFQAFAVLPQYWASHFPALRDKVTQELTKELEKIGKVVQVKELDVTAFGKSQARIGIFVRNIFLPGKEEVPILEISLSLTATALLKKVDKTASVLVWSGRTFIEGAVDEKNGEKIFSSVKEVFSSFIHEYRRANQGKKGQPLFYFYSQPAGEAG